MPAPPPSSSFTKQRKEPRHGSSLPLLAFAGAKKTTYDPRVAKQKASNLAAKRVNEFRKLKARLEAEGRLAVPSSISKATMDAAEERRGEEEVRKEERQRGKKERRERDMPLHAKKLKIETDLFPPFPNQKTDPTPPPAAASRCLLCSSSYFKTPAESQEEPLQQQQAAEHLTEDSGQE